MSLPTRRLSRRLADLAIGQRFWFWLCPDAVVPLAISSMTEDPDTLSLNHEVGRIWRPRRARTLFGIGEVDATGRITLAAQQATGADLKALARWAVDSGPENPELGRLSGTVLLLIDESLAVLRRFDRPALWDGLPAVHAEGTAAAAAHILEALPVDSSAWLWAAAGEGGEAALLVTNSQTDADLADIKRLMQLALRRGIPTDQLLMGAAIRSADAIMLRTRSPAAHEVLRTLRQTWPELAVLRQIKLKMQEESDLSSEVLLLMGMEPGERLWFGFSATDGGTLALATEEQALRERMQALNLHDPLADGRLALDPHGWFELQLHTPCPALLPALARWVLDTTVKWPAIRRLTGTRLTVRDADGRVLERHHDRDLWPQG